MSEVPTPAVWYCDCERRCNCAGTPKKLHLWNEKRCTECGCRRPDLQRRLEE